MTEFQIRLAKISDVEPILNFCLHTWENQKDYMSLVLDKRISDPKGKIYVATFDDIPVAMEQLVILSKQEAWRDSLRVDPHYRRRGLSKLLDLHINKYLSQTNVSIMRCCVYSNNEIMVKIISKRGYKKVESYSLYKAEPISLQTNKLIRLELKDFDSVWSLITRIDLEKERQKFYTTLITKCQIFTPELLKECLCLGRVFGFRQNERLLGIAIQSYSEISEQEFYIGYIHGEQEILTVILSELRKLAYSLGNVVVRGVFSLNNIFGNCLSQAGFQRIKQAEAGIYECQVINKQLGI